RAGLWIGSNSAHGRPGKVILRTLGVGVLEAAAASGFHAATIGRRAAVAVAAVFEKVVQPAMTMTTARIAGIAAGRFGRAASRFRHAAGGLGGAAGRLAAAGHMMAAAEGLGVMAEARDRTGDQQQREQNLGFHSGDSPKGSRIVGTTARGISAEAGGACYCSNRPSLAGYVNWASYVRFLRNAIDAAFDAKLTMAMPGWKGRASARQR
ncbi:MAG TPA: hypothetical protein VFW87_17075, partial [Pirellulales bacterium]|nr:hypothetical protein [Pirellulales bacterium]